MPSSSPLTHAQNQPTPDKLHRFKPPPQFTLPFLILCLFVSFGIHNLLQEAIMNLEGFTNGLMLGYLEVLGVTLFSSIERTYVAKETTRVAPLKSFVLLTFCLTSSSSLSNMSLNYINYPTKVVFRSSKLLPTMLLATLINRKTFSLVKYLTASLICTGMILFSIADSKSSPTFNSVGLILVTLSVLFDSVLPNAQERLFSLGSSRLEVTVYTNFFVLISLTISTFLSGDLTSMLAYFFSSPKPMFLMTLYVVISYVAVGLHMHTIHQLGSVQTVLIGTGRKAMTIVLSFLVFPKGFNCFYGIGFVFVIGGLIYEGLELKGKEDNGKENKDLKTYVPDEEGKQLLGEGARDGKFSHEG